MYKIVLQIPEEEGFDPDPWQESSDPHVQARACATGHIQCSVLL